MSSLAAPALDIDRIRKDFPILSLDVKGKPLVYLDNGATSQKPQAVIDALDTYWAEQNANIHRGVHYLSQLSTRLYDEARVKVQHLLKAQHACEVIFTKGCTESINLVASSLFFAGHFEPGDEILVSTMEHHSNIVPWQFVAERAGATVIPIPVTDRGEIDLDAYATLLNSGKVRVVAIVHVSNALGTINPIKKMAELAHQHGALVMVDGAQAGPHLRIDVQELDADFYSLSCHKMYAPTGVGVLYGKKRHLESMPPYQGGGDMIRTVSFEGTTYAALPAKFEAGTPNIAGVIGLGAAIDYISGLGHQLDASSEDPLETAFGWIQAREKDLTDYGTNLLLEIEGLKLSGTAPEKAGILAFTLDGAHPHDIGTILDADAVAVRAGHHCCMPLMKRYGLPATVRASVAFYNTRSEIEQLASSVRKVRELFA